MFPSLEAALPQRQPLAVSSTCTKQLASVCVLGKPLLLESAGRILPIRQALGDSGNISQLRKAPSVSSELSLKGFELKTAAYTVKTHADLIPFLKGRILRKPALFGDKGLFSVGSDPASCCPWGRSGALAPPTGRPTKVRR